MQREKNKKGLLCQKFELRKPQIFSCNCNWNWFWINPPTAHLHFVVTLAVTSNAQDTTYMYTDALLLLSLPFSLRNYSKLLGNSQVELSKWLSGAVNSHSLQGLLMTASSHKIDTFHLTMLVNHITINQGTIHVHVHVKTATVMQLKNCQKYILKTLVFQCKDSKMIWTIQYVQFPQQKLVHNVTIIYAAQILHSPQYGIIFYSPLFCHSKTKHTQSKVVQQVGQGNIKVNFLTPNKIQYHNITQRYNK